MILNIRRMNDADLDGVYSIETNVHITPWSKEILRDCVLVGYDCRIIEIDSGGSSLLGGYIISRHSENKCHILNFCIAKSLQSQGYGRKFLEAVLDSLSQKKDIYSVVLEVRPSNIAALHLYETMGFQQVEVRKNYYKDNGGTEDAILLEKMVHE